MSTETGWRRCSVCKNPIALRSKYWTCNVSTCNRKRTGLVFCSVECWDVHLPGANHREAWAEEQTAPGVPEPETKDRGGSPRTRQRRIVKSDPAPAPVSAEDVLIIASRLKAYVRERSGFNTSDRVLSGLSEIVRRACDDAIETARRDGRTTVLDRDVPTR